MTRIFEQDAPGGGVRVLILGAGTYPNAQAPQPRVPMLEDISSATQSALDLAYRFMGPWLDRFSHPIASLDLLANAPGSPDNLNLGPHGGPNVVVDAPTMTAVKAAKTRWLKGATPADKLVFYCCGHGLWIPSGGGRTFLASNFGDDTDNPWPAAVQLDDFLFALGEKAPRSQWMIFDCCSNMPSDALKALAARPDSLLTPVAGARQQAADDHGPLEQVSFFSSTMGAQAFGKDHRASRFMEAFLEACDGSAYLTEDDAGAWWADRQTIEKSIVTYAKRVAPPEDEAYFTFAQVSATDAATIPRLMHRDAPSTCTLLARSEPAYLLAASALSITCPPNPAIVGAQPAGGEARYRQAVAAWEKYQVTAILPDGLITKDKLALPPIAEVVF